MTTSRILRLSLISLFILSTTAQAGDYANLNFIGFSKDGRYLAFEEHGVLDGSGFPYSSFYFIDVTKNSYAAQPINVRLENEFASEQQARLRARTRAAAHLRRLKIVNGNTGKLVVSRLLTDLGVNSGEWSKAHTIRFAESVGSMYREGDYLLTLTPSEVKSKDCEFMSDPVYKLELVLKDNEADKATALQKDAALPVSRTCPLGYEMQFVYLYGNHIAVFVNIYTMGFEGPDMRFLAVTGKYK